MNSTERFTDRVADYVKYRPHYPQAVFDTLRDEMGFRHGTSVADIGSGTGISTNPLLDLGCTVFAVEPNAEMRAAAEQTLNGNERFRSVAGTAEKTTLPAQSLDGILVAQAFHWFDMAKARTEFKRISKPSASVALLWNERRQSGSAFLDAYERLVQEFGTDYDHVKVEGRYAAGSGALSKFFGSGGFRIKSFENQQEFDLQGLTGRLLSSSYAPQPMHPNHAAMMADLRQIFAENSSGGRVRMLYETNIYFGCL